VVGASNLTPRPDFDQAALPKVFQATQPVIAIANSSGSLAAYPPDLVPALDEHP
jgi:hypothetical protein